jgi:hypothetical protein
MMEINKNETFAWICDRKNGESAPDDPAATIEPDFSVAMVIHCPLSSKIGGNKT